MKKSHIIIGQFVLIIITLFSSYTGRFDKAEDFQETVNQKWVDVRATDQRRSDLVAKVKREDEKSVEDFDKVGKQIN